MSTRSNFSLSRVRLRRVLLVAGCLACLSFTASSAAAVSLVNPALVASSVAGKPVSVAMNSFGNGTWTGGAFVSGDQIFLGQDAYRDAERGGGVGLFVLLHEAGHTTGIADDHIADCFALEHIKGVLRTFWHLRSRQVEQRYRDALLWPGKYDGNRCAGVGEGRDRAYATAWVTRHAR
jgi:hypothetical protein